MLARDARRARPAPPTPRARRATRAAPRRALAPRRGARAAADQPHDEEPRAATQNSRPDDHAPGSRARAAGSATSAADRAARQTTTAAVAVEPHAGEHDHEVDAGVAGAVGLDGGEDAAPRARSAEAGEARAGPPLVAPGAEHEPGDEQRRSRAIDERPVAVQAGLGVGERASRRARGDHRDDAERAQRPRGGPSLGRAARGRGSFTPHNGTAHRAARVMGARVEAVSTHGWRRRFDPRADDEEPRRDRRSLARAHDDRTALDAVRVRGLRKAYGERDGPRRRGPDGRARRGARAARPQRRRQDDAGRDPRRPPPRRRRQRVACSASTRPSASAPSASGSASCCRRPAWTRRSRCARRSSSTAAAYPQPRDRRRGARARRARRPRRRARERRSRGGQRRRLDLALGIVGDPELIFLDEPTTGFDPAARRQSWELIAGLRDARQDDPADHALHGGGAAPRRPHRRARARAA